MKVSLKESNVTSMPLSQFSVLIVSVFVFTDSLYDSREDNQEVEWTENETYNTPYIPKPASKNKVNTSNFILVPAIFLGQNRPHANSLEMDTFNVC